MTVTDRRVPDIPDRAGRVVGRTESSGLNERQVDILAQDLQAGPGRERTVEYPDS